MTILTTEAKVKLNDYKYKLFAIMPNNEQIDTGTVEVPVMENKYTDSEWVDELAKRHFINLIKRGQAVLHREALETLEVNLE